MLTHAVMKTDMVKLFKNTVHMQSQITKMIEKNVQKYHMQLSEKNKASN